MDSLFKVRGPSWVAGGLQVTAVATVFQTAERNSLVLHGKVVQYFHVQSGVGTPIGRLSPRQHGGRAGVRRGEDAQLGPTAHGDRRPMGPASREHHSVQR